MLGTKVQKNPLFFLKCGSVVTPTHTTKIPETMDVPAVSVLHQGMRRTFGIFWQNTWIGVWNVHVLGSTDLNGQEMSSKDTNARMTFVLCIQSYSTGTKIRFGCFKEKD